MKQVRDRILKAAKGEFSEKGYDGTRMGAIAQKAGVNQAMIHYYFDTKENLYEQVLLDLFGLEKKSLIINFFTKYDSDPPQNLYLGIYFLVHLYLNPRNPGFERFVHSQIGSGGMKRIVKITKKFLLPQFQFLEKTLQLGMESGYFEPSDIVFTAMEIVLYVTTYEGFRWHFADTDTYSHIYGKDYKKRAFDFLIKHTFKGLCPKGKELIIPTVPENLIKELDKTIDAIINKTRGSK